MTIIISAFLALKPITAGNTSPVRTTVRCSLMHMRQILQCLFGLRPLSGDYSRKSCSNSIAAKHQNVQGVSGLSFLHMTWHYDPQADTNMNSKWNIWEKQSRQCQVKVTGSTGLSTHPPRRRWQWHSPRLKSSWCPLTDAESATVTGHKKRIFISFHDKSEFVTLFQAWCSDSCLIEIF